MNATLMLEKRRNTMRRRPQPAVARSPEQRAELARRIAALLQLATGPTRMSILLLLDETDRYAGEICEALGNGSQPSVSHQLSLLRHGGLVQADRDGRKILYRLTDSGRTVVRAFKVLDR